MLHNVLGFGGRMARLEYFLFSVALVILVLMLALALTLGLGPLFETAAGGRGSSAPRGLILTVAVVVLPIYLWFSLAFEAKRFRDIGWNPLYVIPGWIAAILMDKVVAFAVPALALGGGNGTLVGALLNLFMAGSLLFWPSGPSSAGDWDGGIYPMGSPEPEIARATIRSPRRTAAPSPAPAPAPSGFGRRGL